MPIHGFAVNVLCAWCQAEGKPALLRVVEVAGGPAESHGICSDHQREVLAAARARYARPPASREDAQS